MKIFVVEGQKTGVVARKGDVSLLLEESDQKELLKWVRNHSPDLWYSVFCKYCKDKGA